ncbi:MAG: hypothetical protein H7833_18370 [Magnetococcus sp. DMHC-1]|nr:hypothetical protein [Magnetococcales bacterium]
MRQNFYRKMGSDTHGWRGGGFPNGKAEPAKLSELIRSLLVIKEKYGISERDFSKIVVYVSSFYVAGNIESRVNDFIRKNLSADAIVNRML